MYFAFDLLWLHGRDLRNEPQIKRKELLKDLIEEHDLKEPVHYSEQRSASAVKTAVKKVGNSRNRVEKRLAR